MKDDKKQEQNIEITLDKDLEIKLQSLAIEHDTTLDDVVNTLLRGVLNE